MKSPLRRSFTFPVAMLSLGLCFWIASAPLSSAASPLDTNAGAVNDPVTQTSDTVVIPGPLRSFLRMAGISQEVAPPEVLPLLARKAYLDGYQQGNPTEYLLLVDRYLQQARELQILAGSSNQIKVTNCDDAGTLIRILGYRQREACGQPTFSLETTNPTRAFLTIDSGFPLVQLEEALQNGTPFVYSYPSTRVPVLFHGSDWAGLRAGQKRASSDPLDVLLSDPSVSRLYSAMSKQDTETRQALQQSVGLAALLPYAGVMDFYGSQICIRSGRVLVPGGTAAQPTWKELVGASPDTPGPFVLNLVSKDRGWLAAYFDTLSRIADEQQQHLTEPSRLKRLYGQFRDEYSQTSATEGVFRKAAGLMVLFTRVQWEPDGSPHVPGDLDTWKDILRQKTDVKAIRELGRQAHGWKHSEQLLEGMTRISPLETDIGPLQVYLLANEIDRNRPPEHRISPATLRLIAERYSQFNTWYQVFTEFPSLDDASITRFVNIADAVNRIPNQSLRENTEGSFQATVGLWQILARQGQIPEPATNQSWQHVIEPFSAVAAPFQLFDAARNSLGALLTATGGSPNSSQAELVDLLAGPAQQNPNGQRVHLQLASRINSVLEDQRLVSLDTLFALSDGMKHLEQNGGKQDDLLPLAEELREFDLPQPIFTRSEKISWAPPIYTEHHAQLQVRTDLTNVIKGPSSPGRLEAARGQLAPFLRDTLVGLNYAYYEPPDAQMLHHNPLFVRSHDFLGISVIGASRLWGAPEVLGVGTPAGGGAYLMGSLSDLPYALATTEQDFIAPKNIQALIWKEIAPVLMVSAIVPRYWSVSPAELHAAALYQRSGEELLTAAAGNTDLRAKVITVLFDHVGPQGLDQVNRLLRSNDVSSAIPLLTPAEIGSLADEFRTKYPDVAPDWGPYSRQLEDLRSRNPKEASWERISCDFGVPHPTLASTNARRLFDVKPFPFFGAYSSRLFGESWESGNLYWARLADEKGFSPADLNNLVPMLTRRMIENIFATDIEDWPAVQRAMKETGDEFLQGKIAPLPAINRTSNGTEQAVQDATTR